MASEKIQLSISILISNRPETVEKCLKSLDSLRRQIVSELILVDTGCGEAVRRMIEPYADKIVDFEWCNDFAKARNAGLKQARGEWFLYLDDDEWFESTEEIEDFFLSGRHLQYNYGFYLVRNYRDPQGRVYSDDYVGRMVRLAPEVQFVFSIHECLTNVKGPAIWLHSYVHHYGYAYENEEAMRRHCRRNIELLLAEREKDPSEIHHILQLTQEYNALKEWEKVVEIAREGIQNSVPGPKGDCYRGGFYGAVVRALVALKRYDQAVETGEKYLGMGEPDELAAASVCYFLSIAYLEMGEGLKSLGVIEQYRHIYIKWQENKNSFLQYETLLTDETFAEESVRQVLYRGVRCGIRLGDTRLAKDYFDEIKWDISQNSVDVAALDMIQEIVRAWLRTEADRGREYTAMMQDLLGNNILARAVVMDIHLLQEKSPELLQTKVADWAALADRNWIFLYYKMKNIPETERDTLMADYHNLWKEPGECLMRAQALGLWEMAQRDCVPMEEILSHIPMQRWKQAAETAAGELDWREVQELQKRLQELAEADDFRMMYWNVPYRMRRVCVMSADRNPEEQDRNGAVDGIVQALLEYAIENQKLCRRLYREELFREAPGFLPQECQLSLKILEMNNAAEAGNLEKALSAVREALEIMPELSNALKCCAQWLSQKSRVRDAEQEKAKKEMRNLAEAVKARVYSMLSQGMLAEAAGILAQMKVLAPEDKEIIEMEKEILRIQQS